MNSSRLNNLKGLQKEGRSKGGNKVRRGRRKKMKGKNLTNI